MGKFQKGHIPTKEMREKMRDAKLKNPVKFWSGKKHPHRGRKKLTLEQKELSLQLRKNKGRIQSKEANKKRRIIVLEYYSGKLPKCACCGESTYEFLSIDHINGGGNKHRKEMGMKNGKGGNIYHWLIKNNFPEGYQVLCHNCNMAKGFYGICPHNVL